MDKLADNELLAEFARNESEAAFATLVARYVNLVYSAALRFTRNSNHAEDITQAVFIVLAHKARSLKTETVLSGWLYQVARFTALNFIRTEKRREQREHEACEQSTLNDSNSTTWREIEPLLDEAMGDLGQTDRNAMVLRYFENRTVAEVGARLKVSNAAAQMRLHRALEKMRKYLNERGVTLSGEPIARAVSANSVVAAPFGLAARAAAMAAKGAVIPATLTMLVKGTMKTMAWLKAQFVTGAGVAALLAAGAITMAVSQTAAGDKLSAQNIAQKSRQAYAALSSYSDRGTVIMEFAGMTNTLTFTTRLQRPNLYRIEWTRPPNWAPWGALAPDGVVWSDGAGDYFMTKNSGQDSDSKPQKMDSRRTTLTAAIGYSLSASSTMPEVFFNEKCGDVFVAPVAMGRYPLTREQDATVGGVDCYVVSSAVDLSKIPDADKPGTSATTVWIGKKDFLIRQTRNRYIEKVPDEFPDSVLDDAIKKSLEIQHKPVTPEAIAAMRPQMRETMKQVQSMIKTGFAAGGTCLSGPTMTSVSTKTLLRRILYPNRPGPFPGRAASPAFRSCRRCGQSPPCNGAPGRGHSIR